MTSPIEMCTHTGSFYEGQFSKHPNTAATVDFEAESVSKQINSLIKETNVTAPTITVKDITKIIYSLKNKCSYGVVGVSNKMIKILPKAYHLLICNLFNDFFSGLCMPLHCKLQK